MLIGIEERGRDATGIGWKDATNGTLYKLKKDLSATQLLRSLSPDEPRGARSAILHTRYATLGAPEANVNNHPIDTHGLLGTHNGVCSNHNAIFAMLNELLDDTVTRHGQVDSEAIFAALAFRKDLEASVGDVLELVEGSAALAWLEARDRAGTLHLARVSSSPLVIGYTRTGSLLYASTSHALKKAAMAGGFRIVQEEPLPEGTYLKVRNGRIVEHATFTARRASYAYAKPNYNRPSRFEADTVAVGFEADDDAWEKYQTERAANSTKGKRYGIDKHAAFADYVAGDLTYDEYMAERFGS
jgi:glucosamine 6-phosphate synthetase-like amidotransferase/phosphosugar isomerase protein